MNGLGYPTSYQSGASQLVPANSSISFTNHSAPAYGAAMNVQIQAPVPETFSTLRSPSGWSAPSRQTSRPCRCGRGRCRWQFSYPIRMMIAVYKELPFQPQSQGSCPHPRKLSIYQKETFLVSQNGPEVSFLKTFESPLYRFSRNNAQRRQLFLRCEPWVDADRVERDTVVCLGCRC
ncbi:uncharacterized protein BT62DRAFT_458759, partial [Guyanagaster necrorhizus]